MSEEADRGNERIEKVKIRRKDEKGNQFQIPNSEFQIYKECFF